MTLQLAVMDGEGVFCGCFLRLRGSFRDRLPAVGGKFLLLHLRSCGGYFDEDILDIAAEMSLLDSARHRYLDGDGSNAALKFLGQRRAGGMKIAQRFGRFD